MAGFGGSTGVSKGYVDRAIAQSTADASTLRPLTTSNASITIPNGYYIQLGKMVLVSGKIVASATVPVSSIIITNLPVNATQGSALLLATVLKTYSCRVAGSNAYLNQDLPAGEYWVNGVIIAN